MANSHQKGRPAKYSVPPRHKPVLREDGNMSRSRRATAPRDIVMYLACDEAIELMRHDRKVGNEWQAPETTAALRYIESLCYGQFGCTGNPGNPTDQPHRKQALAKNQELDCSVLAEWQIEALQTVYMYVVYFEEDRSLKFNVVLPGMAEDWFNERIGDLIDTAEKFYRQSVRWSEKTGKPINLDFALAASLRSWRDTTRKTVQKAQEESTETTVEDADADLQAEMTDEEIAEAFAEVTPDQIAQLI